MKKSIQKKLSLSKSTVSDLVDDEMAAVRGGYVTARCDTGCYCTFGCGGPAYTMLTRCCPSMSCTE